MRTAFKEILDELAQRDERIIFLTGDLGFQLFDEFKNKYKDRYINVGVVEAQMAVAAAGLALEGFKPIIYSIASFLLRRSFEQLKISIGYHNLPIVIIGAGGGFSYSTSGPTHHSSDDLSLMSLIPEMTITSPGSPDELKEILPQLINLDSPSYMRIGKFGETNYSSRDKTILNKLKTIYKGQDYAFITTGDLVTYLLPTFNKLKENNIDFSFFQAHTIVPLDLNDLKSKLENIKTLIIIEESLEIGGLSYHIKKNLSKINLYPKIIRFGPSDNTVLGNPYKEDIRKKFKYDNNSFVKFCNHLFKVTI